jgi:hypothetical protein
MGFKAMSRVHYSFDTGIAAIAEAADSGHPVIPRAPRRLRLKSRARLRRAIENLGLFAFGFGATNLLIHFAVGFFYALRMSTVFSTLNL